MKIFLISPVRNITDEEKCAINHYILSLERAGHKVYLPLVDTNQDDPIGLRICQDSRRAIEGSDEIHVWWNGKSEGSFFDFGMAFALRKKIVLANFSAVKPTEQKSFNNVLRKIGGS